jgi:tetraacyldisaccharide 4'-kinase
VKHRADQVGDEPLLIAPVSTVWVSDDRQAGCRAAVADGAKTVILDDGFQDPSINKDLSLVVVDGGYGFGNGHCMPAGPLRESIDSGLGRADAVVIIGEDTSGTKKHVAGYGPVLHARLVPEAPEYWQGKKVVAFAGIGRPEKFFESLKSLDCQICQRFSFADHHPYSDAELNELKTLAQTHDAILVTTQKDLVRIPETDRQGIEALTVALQWDDVSQLETLINKHLPR